MRTILALLLTILLASAPAFAAKKAGTHKKASAHKVVVHQKKKPKSVSIERPACDMLKLSDDARVSAETPGYRKVRAEFDIPVPSDKKPGDEAGTMNIKFGIFWNGATIKLDRDTYLKDVGTCTRDHVTNGRFFAGGTVWLRAGFVPEAEGNTDTSYRLTSELVLPEALIAEKPRGYTVMRTGVYVLKWDEEGNLPIMRFERQ